jgi:hypothetical protein
MVVLSGLILDDLNMNIARVLQKWFIAISPFSIIFLPFRLLLFRLFSFRLLPFRLIVILPFGILLYAISPYCHFALLPFCHIVISALPFGFISPYPY